MCNVPCELCGDFYECDLATKYYNFVKKYCDKVHGNCAVCELSIIENGKVKSCCKFKYLNDLKLS